MKLLIYCKVAAICRWLNNKSGHWAEAWMAKATAANIAELNRRRRDFSSF
jgi:hypothetical protein